MAFVLVSQKFNYLPKVKKLLTFLGLSYIIFLWCNLLFLEDRK